MTDARARLVRRPWASFVLFALVLAASAGGILILGAWAQRGTSFERYSTYRAEPDGASACFEWLQDLGFSCARLTEDLRSLPDDRSLVVLVAPFARDELPPPTGAAAPPPAFAALGSAMAPGEVENLVRWVKKGGRLLVLEGHQNPLYRALDIGVDGPAEPTENLVFEARPASWSVYTATGARLELANRARFVVPEKGPSWTVLFADPKGAPAAVAAPLGKGEVVLFCDPRVATNDGLKRAGNDEAVLAAVLASDARTVRFDELRHGFASTRTVMGYLRRHGLHLAVVQGAVTFVLGVWAAGRARRRPRGATAQQKVESRELVAAMANIYARASLAEHAARGYLRRCVRALALALGRWPATTSDEEIAARLRAQGVRNFRGWETVRDEALALGLVSELVPPPGLPGTEAQAPDLAALLARAAQPGAALPVPTIKPRRLLAFARLAGNLEREVRVAARVSVDDVI